ncbi:MAG: hypothetical protein QM478_13540 [Flavobacteriaceae bacterium]
MKTKKFQPEGMIYTDITTINIEKGVDIQEYYPEHLEEYVTKTLEENPNNNDFIKPMTYDGFV